MHDSFVLKIFLDLGCIGVKLPTTLAARALLPSLAVVPEVKLSPADHPAKSLRHETLARMQRNYSGQLAWIDNRNSLATFSLHSQFGEAYARSRRQITAVFCLAVTLRANPAWPHRQQERQSRRKPRIQERPRPLGTVLAPQNDRISLRDLALPFARNWYATPATRP